MSKIEVEVKLMGVDREELFKRLKDLGVSIREEDQHDFVVILEEGKEYIRVRKVGERAILTYKRKIGDINYARALEYELEVNDMETMRDIMRNLFRGKMHLEIRKRRWIFSINNVKGEYVEIDNKVRYVELEGDEKSIEDTIKLLGLEKYERSTEPLDIILQRVGITPKKLE